MARPALSASRSMDVIDFLATFPQRAFTLSEIMRAANINVASCHAVLTALEERGYLQRSQDQKTYKLGASLIAAGQAARRAMPIVDRAIEAAEKLATALDTTALLCTIVGSEILSVYTVDNQSGRMPMQVGERLPLIAPLGAPFLAWSSAEKVKEWVDRRRVPLTSAQSTEVYRDLEITRSRGFHITLTHQNGPGTGALIEQMATRTSITDYRGEVSELIDTIDHYRSQPETIVEDASYDVLLISAPIVDQTGGTTYNLCLGGFERRLSGRELQDCADRLTRACLTIMRADRAQLR